MISERRAAAVLTALVKRGVEKERLSSEGFGEERPLESNETEEGRAANRRVEFHIVEAAEKAAEPKKTEPVKAEKKALGKDSEHGGEDPYESSTEPDDDDDFAGDMKVVVLDALTKNDPQLADPHSERKAYVIPDYAKNEWRSIKPEYLVVVGICPHLGCKVHWEVQNERFFCPCHNGAFNADGEAIAGPPLDSHQNLARFPLKLENGRSKRFVHFPKVNVFGVHTGNLQSFLCRESRTGEHDGRVGRSYSSSNNSSARFQSVFLTGFF